MQLLTLIVVCIYSVVLEALEETLKHRHKRYKYMCEDIFCDAPYVLKNIELDCYSLDNIQLLEQDLMPKLLDWEFNFAFQNKRDIKDSYVLF